MVSEATRATYERLVGLAETVLRAGHSVVLWGRDPAQMREIAGQRRNRAFFGDLPLPQTLAATSDLQAALEGADYVLLATPCAAFRELLRTAAPVINAIRSRARNWR